MKVSALYFGMILLSTNQPPNPLLKPNIVSRTIISQCLRSIPKTSFGVIEAAVPCEAIIGLRGTLLGEFAADIRPASVIYIPVQRYFVRQQIVSLSDKGRFIPCAIFVCRQLYLFTF